MEAGRHDSASLWISCWLGLMTPASGTGVMVLLFGCPLPHVFGAVDGGWVMGVVVVTGLWESGWLSVLSVVKSGEVAGVWLLAISVGCVVGSTAICFAMSLPYFAWCR